MPAAPATPNIPRAFATAADFMALVALRLGMPPPSGDMLPRPMLLQCPNGLTCRLHLQDHEDGPVVLPEMLLPVEAQTLSAPEVASLLAAQLLLAANGQWCIGVSAEGLLHLRTLQPVDDPDTLVRAIDMTSLAARQLAVAAFDAKRFPETPAEAASDAAR